MRSDFNLSAAALKYRIGGEKLLAVVGASFCVFVIGWSTVPVLLATLVSLVVFVLVLRRLPDYFTDRPLLPRRYLRMALGAAVRRGDAQRVAHRHPELLGQLRCGLVAALDEQVRMAAEQASRVMDIPVTGMDFLVPAVDGPDYVIVEANERPGLANHEPQPTAQRFVDLLFPTTRVQEAAA